MRTVVMIVLGSLLVQTLIPASAQAHQATCSASTVNEIRSFSGPEATAHLQNLKAKLPEAFEEVELALRGRGFTPTPTVSVIRVEKPLDAAEGAVAAKQEYREANHDGEIVFWSWDDGDNSTWEGTIYVEDYGTGEKMMMEGQLDVSTENIPWVYAVERWRERPGPIEKIGAPVNRLDVVFEAGVYEWAKCWRSCVVAGCSAAASLCLFLGPGWPACFGARCAAAEIGCALGCLLQ